MASLRVDVQKIIPGEKMMFFQHDKYRTRVEFKFVNKNIVLYVGNDPELITFGMVNETQDNYFVPFVDYDNILYEKVVKDIAHVQRVFSLSDIVVISSSEDKTANEELYGNYLCVGFDKLTFQEHLEMLCHTRCDRNYIGCPKFYKRKHWVLRFTEKWYSSGGIHKDKPKFKGIVHNSPPFARKCSYAHYLMLKNLFSVPPLRLNWDTSTECELIQYRTGMK